LLITGGPLMLVVRSITKTQTGEHYAN